MSAGTDAGGGGGLGHPDIHDTKVKSPSLQFPVLMARLAVSEISVKAWDLNHEEQSVLREILSDLQTVCGTAAPRKVHLNIDSPSPREAAPSSPSGNRSPAANELAMPLSPPDVVIQSTSPSSSASVTVEPAESRQAVSADEKPRPKQVRRSGSVVEHMLAEELRRHSSEDSGSSEATPTPGRAMPSFSLDGDGEPQRRKSLVSRGSRIQEPDAPQLQMEKERLKNLFAELDSDGNGTVSYEELKIGMANIGESSDRVFQVLKAADTSGDGVIDREEWDTAVDGLEGRLLSKIAALTVRQNYEEESYYSDRFMLRQKSSVRVLWDGLLLLLLIYIAIMVPFVMGFEPEVTSFLAGMEHIINSVFIVDILLNFRTGYTEEDGVEELSWNKVGLRYLRTWFVLDFVSSVPIDYIIQQDKSTSDPINPQTLKLLKSSKVARIFKMVRFIKMFKIVRSSDITERLSDMVQSSRAHARATFVVVFGFGLVLCHWLACFMAASGDMRFLESYRDFDDAGAARRYGAAMYWAMTTMSTCGYGDVTPQADSERHFAIVAMVVGCGYWGYVLGHMTSVISSNDLNTRAYYARMDEVQAWLDFHKFPPAVQRRVRKYFRQMLSQKGAPDESAIMNDLSLELRDEIGGHLISLAVRRNMLFDSLPEGVLARLVTIIQSVMVETGERLVQMGDIGSAMIIIEKGTANMLTINHNGEQDTKVLSAGDSFGEGIILGQEENYSYTVTATSPMEISYIPETDFLNLFWSMPDVIKQMVYNLQKNCLDPAADEGCTTPPRGRASMVRGSATIPIGFPDAVFDALEDLQAMVKEQKVQLDKAVQDLTIVGI